MLHQRTSCSGLHRQHTARPATRPATTGGARDRCRPVSSSGTFLWPLPTAGTRRCSTSAQRRGKPSVRVASASTDSGDDLQVSRSSWRREAAKAVAVALPAPLHDFWAGLLQLLGFQSNSDYEFRIYKSEVQPPPAVTPTAENEQHHAIISTRPSAAAAPELSVASSSASVDAAGAPAAATSTAAWDDLGRIRNLSLPLMAQNVFEYLMTVVCTISIGHLGAAELAASSLANSVYIVSGLSLALGLSSAMETLCGQAYGAKEYKTLGHVLQRALLVCWVACIPVALLWTHSTALMLAVGQTPAVAAMAGRYLQLCIPCIFLNIGTDCMKKYLQAQHIVSPGMYANAASTFLAPLFFWVLVTKLGLGLDGAAMAFILCQLTSFVGVGAYIAWHAKKNEGSKTSTWGGFSASAAFSKWWQYLQYGIPAMLMISLEWWVYQIPIVMIGWLPNPQAALGVGGICVAFNGWGYMCALGLSQAVNTLISNALGAGDASGAKRATALGVVCMVILQLGMMATMLLGGETLVRFISNDALVVSLALKTLPVLCGVMLMDGLNTVLYSVVRASGEQAAGSLISGSYLVIATALTYGINFMLPPHILQHLPLLGSMEPVARIWMGVVLGAVCQFAVLATYIWKFDWKEQAQRATQRALAVGGH